jgi:hypothetical protein
MRVDPEYDGGRMSAQDALQRAYGDAVVATERYGYSATSSFPAASMKRAQQGVLEVKCCLCTTSLSALHVWPTHRARLISPPLLLLLPLETYVIDCTAL